MHSDELAKHRARLLAQAIKEHGWGQKELARQAKVSQAYINTLLKGESKRPGVDVLKRLSAALGIDLAAEPSSGGPPVGLDDFLRSPWGSTLTAEERAFLMRAYWIPTGKKATVRDWFMFLQLVRGLPNESGGDQ